MKVTRSLCGLLAMAAMLALMMTSRAYAVDAPAVNESAGSPVSYQIGEVGRGAVAAIEKLTAIFANLIDAAVTISQSLDPQSDKMAGGLAVITIVLTAVRYASTRDPVTAWQSVFEDLVILGIFGSLYLGYGRWAPGFYKWFNTLGTLIAGPDGQSLPVAIARTGGTVFDAVMQAFKGAHWWDYIAVAINMLPLIVAWLVLMVTSLVFLFFISLGVIQMAVGIVVGKFAFALGFSEYTRGYFKSWLDYMISAGMYMVVAAILGRLITQSVTTAFSSSLSTGLTTPFAGSMVLDLSIFVLILSFEIPKFASMFGGGASASGAGLGKIARLMKGGL